MPLRGPLATGQPHGGGCCLGKGITSQGFRVFRQALSIGLPDQARDEGAEQSLAPAAGVVDDLEEAEIGGQLLLRDAMMWSSPRAQ